MVGLFSALRRCVAGAAWGATVKSTLLDYERALGQSLVLCVEGVLLTSALHTRKYSNYGGVVFCFYNSADRRSYMNGRMSHS